MIKNELLFLSKISTKIGHNFRKKKVFKKSKSVNKNSCLLKLTLLHKNNLQND